MEPELINRRFRRWRGCGFGARMALSASSVSSAVKKVCSLPWLRLRRAAFFAVGSWSRLGCILRDSERWHRENDRVFCAPALCFCAFVMTPLATGRLRCSPFRMKLFQMAHMIRPPLCNFLQTVELHWRSNRGYETNRGNPFRIHTARCSRDSSVQKRPGSDREHRRNHQDRCKEKEP